MQQRNYLTDNLKFILIFLVVFGHLIEPANKENIFNQIYFSIYIFHMPIFILISGYYTKLEKPSFRRLLLIYIPLQFLYTLCSIALNIHTQRTVLDEIVSFIFIPNWILWYLFAMMLWKPLLRLFTRNTINKVIIITAIIMYNFIPLNYYYLSVGRVLSFFPFFVVGYYMRKYEIDWDQFKLSKLQLLTACLTFFATCILLAGKIDIRLLYGSVALVKLTTHPLLYFIIKVYLQIIALLVGFILVTIVPNKQMKISKIGTQTLAIYVYHAFVLRGFGLLGFTGYIPNIGIIGSLLVDFILTFVIIIILKNIPVITLEKFKFRKLIIYQND